MPKTKLGKWSFWLIVAFFVALGIFYLLVVPGGQRGGMTFFSNPLLAINGLTAAACGIASFFTGMFGIVKSKERAILVFVSTLIGLLVLWFVGAEIAFPH